jgi:hypothetical protein
MKGMVMAENQQQQLTPQQTADLVNKTMAENKTFRAMLADTAEKIANLELRNSELKVQNQSLQQVLASISGQKVETQEEE